LALFSRSQITGAVSFLGRLKHGEDGIFALDAPHFISVSPDGENVYVALWDEDAISVYNRNTDTGILEYNSKIANGGVDANGGTVIGLEGPRSLLVSPDGEQVYVVAWNDDSLVNFDRNDTGALTFVAAHRSDVDGVEGLDGPHSVALSADGKFVYVAAFFDDAISVFARDTDTGAIAYDQTIYDSDEGVEGLNGSLTLLASPDGEHVYSSSTFEKSLVSFRRELLIDPPVFTVEPQSKAIPANSNVSFNALAEGIDVVYQWRLNGAPIPGATNPVYSIDPVEFSLDQSVYSVEASNPGGSVISADAILTVLPEVVLETPENLTAVTQSSSTAIVRWVDQDDSETGFSIERKVAGESFETIAQIFADSEEYLDTGLSPGTEYIYRVRATRPGEVSEWSNEAVIESFDEAPNTPANLTVTLEKYNRIAMEWDDRSAVEDGFVVERRNQSSGGTFAAVGFTERSVTNFIDRSVEPEIEYAYRVRAFNESGSSTYSNLATGRASEIPVTSITPESRTVPSEETLDNLVLVSSNSEWEAISDSDWIVVQEPAGGQGVGSEPVSYRVLEHTVIEDRVGTINIGGLIHTVTQEGANYYIDVIPGEQSIGKLGGAHEFQVSSNTSWTLSTPASWLEIASQLEGSGNATIVFNASENLTGSPRTGTIYVNEKTHVVTQSAGNSPQDPPEPPAGGSSQVEEGDEGILITWEDNSDHELGYIIERTEQGVGNWREIARVPANTTSYLDRNIVPGVAYSYRVSAYNLNGISDLVYIDSEGAAAPSRLVNLSTRAWVGTGDEVLIAGFGIVGDNQMRLMSRSVGPKLSDMQVPDPLANPVMSVRNQSNGLEIASNDDWPNALSIFELEALESSTGAFSIGSSTQDSVVVRNYDPGLFTTVLSGKDGGSGVALLELYEVELTPLEDCRLINLSSRGYVGTGDSVMIGGFVIQGETTMDLLIRGVGPGLSDQGISDPLADPYLTLFSGSEVVAENDNWDDEIASEKSSAFVDAGAFPLVAGSKDAAMIVTLSQGLYTVVLDGASGETGIGLFEIYVLQNR